MIFNYAVMRASFVYPRKSLFLFFAFFLALGFTTSTGAQTTLTRGQFSRMSVLARAAYFEKEILKAAETEGVDPYILWTIAYNETRFRPWLTSYKNAKGMMQFIPSTASRFDLSDPYQPVPAIRAAARYVKYLSGLFGGRVDSILAAYNSGEGTVTAYLYGRTLRDGRKIINPKGQKTIGGVPPYSETIGYVGRGLKVYRWLVSRQTFANSVVRANFPAVISSTVARVPLYDPELGNVPDFNVPIIRQENLNRNTIAQKTQNESSEIPNQPQSNEQKTQEIYYEPRSGNRYLISSGGKVKLDEDGVVVISGDTRSTTNLARSTFFAAPFNK